MYARIDFDPARPQDGMEVRWCRVSILSAEPLPADEANRRLRQVSALVQAAVPQAGVAEQVRLAKLVLPAALIAPADAQMQDLAIHAALAHHRLDDQARLEREQGCLQLIETKRAEFGPLPPALAARIEKLRTAAWLAPDAVMVPYVESQLIAVAQTLHGEDFKLKRKTPHTAAMANVATLLKASLPNEYEALLPMLFLTLHATNTEGVALTMKMLEFLCRNQLARVLVPMVKAVERPLAELENVTRVTHLLLLLKQFLAELQLDPSARRTLEQLILDEIAQMKAGVAQACNCMALTTTQAALSGVPLGLAGEQILRFKSTLQQEQAVIAQGMTLLRLRKVLAQRRQRAAPPGARAATTPAADTAASDDPVHAWSINRLLEWIEGPLVTRPGATPARIDRAALARRSSGAQPAPAGARPAANTAQRPAEPAFSEDDVDLMVRDALDATARFFLDDIAELLPRAKALGASADLQAACHSLQPPLQQLCEHGMPDDEARGLLGEAEAAINALRAGIRAATVEEQKRLRFETRLAAEELALGKAHGGVIDVRLEPDDWAWVAATYHRRWLARLRPITVDGHPCALPADQALALYVTGSSLSGYAFDISVHLWRRRPGSTALPATGNGLYPPMNEADWYDTYQPCAVLHVRA